MTHAYVIHCIIPKLCMSHKNILTYDRTMLHLFKWHLWLSVLVLEHFKISYNVSALRNSTRL